MAHSSEFVTHCLELLGGLGPTQARRMFGAHGLYVDGCFVALVSREVLYLKVDDPTRPAFEAAGCRPFHYTAASGREGTLGY